MVALKGLIFAINNPGIFNFLLKKEKGVSKHLQKKTALFMEEQYKKITETVPIFFFIYQLEKKEIQFISPQFYQLAKDVESEDSNPLKKCIHPDYFEKFDHFFDALSVKNRYEGSVELKANSKLKGIRWLELNTFPVKETDISDVEQVVGHIVNISQKKEMYDTLREEKEHISNMLNMVVHDLRAPFSRIEMIADLLENNMTEEEYKKHSDYLGLLRKQGEESIALIKSLLRLATLKGESKSLDLNIHDLRELVTEGVEQHQTRINEKNLKVSYHFPGESVKAKVDAVLFQQVIANLISNAIKYTPREGEITFRLHYKEGAIHFKITDTGIGIPEKKQHSLFRSFHGFRQKGLEGEQSIGLGLFICKEIVSMHQGLIKVESKEGEGSTFTIILPFPESSAAYY